MIEPNWTTYVQTASWVAAAVTGMIGVWKFGQDNRKDRAQRTSEITAREEATRIAERELEWRRANGAQLVLEKMEDDELSADAMLMLDWDGRNFGDKEKPWYLERRDVLLALRTSGDPFKEKEIYVRDAFDHLFWHLERIQHQIEVELITPRHVHFPIAYLIVNLDRDADAYRAFLKAYGYTGVLKLWDTFKQSELPSIETDYEREFDWKQARESPG